MMDCRIRGQAVCGLRLLACLSLLQVPRHKSLDTSARRSTRHFHGLPILPLFELRTGPKGGGIVDRYVSIITLDLDGPHLTVSIITICKTQLVYEVS